MNKQISNKEFYGYNMNELSRGNKIYTLIISIAFIILGLFSKYRLFLLIGIIFILATFRKREIKITNYGLEVYGDYFISKSDEKLSWDEIDYLTHEDLKNDGKFILYLTSDITTKKFKFLKKDKPEILGLAKEKNPNILIYDGREYKDKVIHN